jgi:hypothetical protein
MNGVAALLWVLALTPAVIALVLVVYAVLAFRKGRAMGGLVRLAVAAVLLGVAALFSVFGFGTWGYRALLAEETAATVTLTQTAPQRFRADFTFPNGETKSFDLAGDQLYVDARFVKWHPYAAFLGLRPVYQLERVAGRYAGLDDEQTAPRTVYALSDAPPLDLHGMTRQFAPLSSLVDAEYGTATFQDARSGARYDVRVSQTGLLIRPAP